MIKFTLPVMSKEHLENNLEDILQLFPNITVVEFIELQFGN